MFRRRFFYDLTTGAMLHSYSAEGNIKQFYPPTEEALALGLTNWGVLEWNEKDLETEAAFSSYDADGKRRVVVAFVVDGVLTFKYKAVGEATEADYIEALEELGVNFDE